jgi:hypothetical protein
MALALMALGAGPISIDRLIERRLPPAEPAT